MDRRKFVAGLVLVLAGLFVPVFTVHNWSTSAVPFGAIVSGGTAYFSVMTLLFGGINDPSFVISNTSGGPIPYEAFIPFVLIGVGLAIIAWSFFGK